jgi:ferredoxin/flavodoxin---NADP+ reductase
MENIIKKKQKVATDTYMLTVKCPGIAQKARPGQFVIVRVSDNGERIPLTIADYSKTELTLVFKVVGFTTKVLSNLRSGSSIKDLCGPLGTPSALNGNGNICFVAGGVGIAAIYPLLKSLKKKGNNNIVIVGAKTKGHLFWLDKIRSAGDKVLISTEDGSLGKKGCVTDVLRHMMRRRLDMVYAVGPLMMMKNVSKMTWRMVKTHVKLNPVMIDGIGICGGCRVKVNGDIKFACIDGPEFNGHELDWEGLINRNSRFIEEEKYAMKKCTCGGK